MGSQLTTLAAADVQRFERDGYVLVRQAFSPADGAAMEQRWWRELEDTHGVRRDDCSSWRQIRGDLKAAKQDPVQGKILTQRVRGVFDDLLGKGPGRRRGTGAEPSSLFQSQAPGTCRPGTGTGTTRVRCTSTVLGRCSSSASSARSRMPADLDPLRLAPSADPAGTPDTREPAKRPGRPALGPVPPFPRVAMALTGQMPSPVDRTAAFMVRETIIDDVALRVVELTGEPGDMVFCHPLMVHCAAPNRGTWPRFMRIKQQVLTHEGRGLRNRLQRLDGLDLG